MLLLSTMERICSHSPMYLLSTLFMLMLLCGTRHSNSLGMSRCTWFFSTWCSWTHLFFAHFGRLAHFLVNCMSEQHFRPRVRGHLNRYNRIFDLCPEETSVEDYHGQTFLARVLLPLATSLRREKDTKCETATKSECATRLRPL